MEGLLSCCWAERRPAEGKCRGNRLLVCYHGGAVLSGHMQGNQRTCKGWRRKWCWSERNREGKQCREEEDVQVLPWCCCRTAVADWSCRRKSRRFCREDELMVPLHAGAGSRGQGWSDLELAPAAVEMKGTEMEELKEQRKTSCCWCRFCQAERERKSSTVLVGADLLLVEELNRGEEERGAVVDGRERAAEVRERG